MDQSESTANVMAPTLLPSERGELWNAARLVVMECRANLQARSAAGLPPAGMAEDVPLIARRAIEPFVTAFAHIPPERMCLAALVAINALAEQCLRQGIADLRDWAPVVQAVTAAMQTARPQDQGEEPARP